MPVATRGAIRALALADIYAMGFDIILSNTYHLYIRPGCEVISEAGGLHRFMNFNRPILTDSGGFQVYSLSNLRKIHDDGIEFRSHIDGSPHYFSPEKVLDIQRVIGSDIMMVLDECTGYPAERKEADIAVRRTVSWASRSFRHWKDSFDGSGQALFAIIQGGTWPDLRQKCARDLVAMDFPGFAIGGLSVGEPKGLYREITESTVTHLPDEKPKYMMGVGSPMEILYAVQCGIDMFDCVMPTRIARNGSLYTSQGRINIKASRFRHDYGPLDGSCDCYVCTTFTRAYLHHLYRVGEIASLMYNTYHNLYFMKRFMADIQKSIIEGAFSRLYRQWDAVYGGDPGGNLKEGS